MGALAVYLYKLEIIFLNVFLQVLLMRYSVLIFRRLRCEENESV